jgi:hypothetical protein
MATAKYAKLMRESAQTAFEYTAATDSGDQTIYTVPGKTVFSGKSGFDVSVRPDGIVTGTNIITTNATNNTVTVAAFTAYLAGTLHAVDASTALAVRPDSAVSKVCSLQLDSDGSTINVVEGTDGATTAFSETRGAAGGPPFVVVGDIEIGQIRFTDNTAAEVLSSEIFQTIGTHVQRWDYPTFKVNNLGDGNGAVKAAQKNAHIEFDSAQGVGVHTANAFKPVYVSGYTPVFSEIGNSVDFKPAQNAHSVSSTQVYNGTIGSSSSSLGQAGFTVAGLNDGITDALVADEEEIITFKFFPNRNKAPYSLTQGILGLVTTYPVAGQIQAASTISAEKKTTSFSS